MSEVSADTVVDCHGAHDIPVGWRRWLFAINHKDIGTPYLLFAMANLMIGGVMALMIRAELFEPGLQTMRPEFFDQLVTEHGLIMIIGAIMPAFVGFGNWMIPLPIGAFDMVFARMNNLSFWLLPVSSVLFLGSFWVPGAGWRASRRMDHVRAVVDADGSRHGYVDLCDLYCGCFLDHALARRFSRETLERAHQFEVFAKFELGHLAYGGAVNASHEGVRELPKV